MGINREAGPVSLNIARIALAEPRSTKGFWITGILVDGKVETVRCSSKAEAYTIYEREVHALARRIEMRGKRK